VPNINYFALMFCRNKSGEIYKMAFNPKNQQNGIQSEKPCPVWVLICGFNIAILTGLLLAASRPLFGLRRSAWFVLLGIALYTVLVGADAAVVRAAIMGALLVVATRLLGRPTFAPAGLFTAALAMTLVNPFILWDVGFQLSFTATLGLMLYVGPWSRWTQNNLQRIADPQTASRLTRTLSEVILATMAAMLLTLPLILYHFERLSLISPIANLFILPAQPGVMIWGGLATLTGMVIPAVGQLFAWVAWLFLSYTIGLVRLFASVPAASLPLVISPASVAALYLIIFCVTWLAWIGPERRGELIAGLGQNLTRKMALAGTVIIAILVVAWALSQPDADHVAGLPGVFDRYNVDRLITNSITAGTETYRALLTEAAEGAMLASGRELSALVYKAGHHGAKTSSSVRFLEAVQPQYVVISAGEENRYGHPHPEMLARAEAIGAAVLRTDELGSIEVITDGEALWWESYWE